MRIGPQIDAALWKESLRTLKRRRSLRNRILGSNTRISVNTPGGIYLADRTAFAWPAHYHDPIIEKITRGLYFHEFKEVLPATAAIKVYWCKTLEDIYSYTRQVNPDMRQLWHELPDKRNAGKSAFRYCFGRAAEDPVYTVWIFDFYGAHFAAAYTSPADDPVGAESDAEFCT